jgi:serine/threonine protein kinase
MHNNNNIITELRDKYNNRIDALRRFPQDMSFAENYGNLILKSNLKEKCLCQFRMHDLNLNQDGLIDVKQFGQGKMSTAHLILVDTDYYIWKDSEAPPPPRSLHLSDRKTLRAPNFYHMLNLSMIMTEILQPLGMNDRVVRQFDAYVCCDPAGFFYGESCKGWSISDLADKGPLPSWLRSLQGITWTDINNILSDVLTPLFILKQAPHYFVHGDLKPGNVFVQSRHRNSDNTGDSGVRFLLADFDKSSVSYNGVRFIGRPTYKMLHSLLKLDTRVLVSCGTYRLSDTFSYPYAVNKIMGTSMFSAFPIPLSFDIYTFIVGLCLDPGVYNIAFRSKDPLKKVEIERFHHLWEQLWDPLEIKEVTYNIGKQIIENDAKKNDSISTIIGLIYKFKLKINVSEIFHEYFIL